MEYQILPEYPLICPPNQLVKLNYENRKWYFSNAPVQNPLLPPKKYIVHPDIEIKRNFYYFKLRHYFYNTFDNKELTVKSGIFETWIWTQLSLQIKEMDPLIPYSAINIDPRIEHELVAKYKLEPSYINACLTKISLESKQYATDLYEMMNSKLGKTFIKMKWDNDILTLTYKNKNVKVNKERFNILKNKYYKNNFINDLFCLLLRYYTLGGNGYQAAAPYYVFDYLKNKLKVSQECFASPLNCYYDTFCSAFPDTDINFGSVGSFFRFLPESGWYEVNPPFSEVVMQKMVEHIEYLLTRTKKSLSFIIIIPKWDDYGSPMWVMMKNSKFLTDIIDIPAGHKYYVGDQHNIKKSWTTTHITSVILLQSKKSKSLTSFKHILNIWNEGDNSSNE